MVMTVVNKNNDKKYEVYDITYDNAGYPHFLIYKEGQWVRKSAKNFRPYDYNDAIRWPKEMINTEFEIGVWNG